MLVITPEMYPNGAVHTYHLLNRKIGSDRNWPELTNVMSKERFHASGLVCLRFLRALQKLFTNFSRTLRDFIVDIGVILSICWHSLIISYFCTSQGDIYAYIYLPEIFKLLGIRK